MSVISTHDITANHEDGSIGKYTLELALASKIVSSDANWYTTFNLLVPNKIYRATFSLWLSPTGNCQVVSMSHFDSLWSKMNSVDPRWGGELPVPRRFVQDFRAIISQCYKLLNPTYTSYCLLFIDVEESYCYVVDSMFSGFIRKKAPYKSTNKTNMCIYLLSMKEFMACQ